MGAEATLLLLDKDVVEQLLTPAEVTQAVREAFLLHGKREGRVFPVVREKLSTGGVFGIKSGDVTSCKHRSYDRRVLHHSSGRRFSRTVDRTYRHRKR